MSASWWNAASWLALLSGSGSGSGKEGDGLVKVAMKSRLAAATASAEEAVGMVTFIFFKQASASEMHSAVVAKIHMQQQR